MKSKQKVQKPRKTRSTPRKTRSTPRKTRSTPRKTRKRQVRRRLRMGSTVNVQTVTSCGPVPERKSFEIMELLGKGSFGSVYKIRSIEDGKYYALKIFQEKENGINELNELNLLCSIRHPNLVHMQYFYFEDKDIMLYDTRDVGYVLPMAQGDLLQYLRQNPNTVPELRIKWAYQFLSAMSFLRKHDIHHCDIKPENCLIVDGNLVVSDYGFANRNFGRHGPCLAGTPMYASPQKVYLQASQQERQRIEAILGPAASTYRMPSTYFTDDVWAVAYTLWFMMTNQLPNVTSDAVYNVTRIFEEIRKADFEKLFRNGFLSKYAKDLGKLFSTVLSVSTEARSRPLEALLSLSMFKSFAPIEGKVVQGTVVKPIDCSKIDTRPYVADIIKYFAVYMNKIRVMASEMGVEPPTDEEGFFIVFNAVDLFYRTFAVLHRTSQDPIPSLTAIAYVVMSSKLTVLGLNYKTWIMRVFGLSDQEVKYIYSIEREVVCLVGGVMSSKLPYEFMSNISEEDILSMLIVLRDNCKYGYRYHK